MGGSSSSVYATMGICRDGLRLTEGVGCAKEASGIFCEHGEREAIDGEHARETYGPWWRRRKDGREGQDGEGRLHSSWPNWAGGICARGPPEALALLRHSIISQIG